MAEALRAGDRRQLRRGRRPRSRARCSPSPARPPDAAAAARPRTPRPGPATSSPPPPPPPGRRSPARPSSCRPLRDAGVVDAGGRGISVILDAAETVLTGRRPVAATRRRRPRTIPMPVPTGDLTAGRPGVRGDVPPRRRRRPHPGAREALAPLGDSLVVVGGEGLWNVHVHVDDVGAAIEAGIDAGRPHRVRVTHFAEQVAARPTRSVDPSARSPDRRGRRRRRAARAVRARPARWSSPGGPGRRPSTGELLEAIERAAAPPRSWCCPTTPTRSGSPRSPPAPPRSRRRDPRRGHPHRRAGPGPGRARRARARPLLRPGRPRR